MKNIKLGGLVCILLNQFITESIKILSLLIKRIIQKEPNLPGIPKEESKNLANIFLQFLILHRKNLNNGYLLKAKSVINKWERPSFLH
jgi:hypothetical protein